MPELLDEDAASEAEEAGMAGDDEQEDDEDEPDGVGSTVGIRYSLPKEGEFVRKILDPKLPTQAEIDEHLAMGHLPYRNWCSVCIRAKGRDMDHPRDTGKERKLPEYGFDYCFPGDELGFKWTVLVGREKGVKSVMATAVPEKGGHGIYARDKILEFMEENGDKTGDVVVKNDQEPAIKLLTQDVVDARPEGKTLLEESPVESHQSNGGAERAVEEMEGEIRALFIGLQDRLGRKLDARERIVAFIPDYAAYLTNRLLRGKDGKVPYERLKGKTPTVLGIEFGEKVLFKKKRGDRTKKEFLRTR